MEETDDEYYARVRSYDQTDLGQVFGEVWERDMRRGKDMNKLLQEYPELRDSVEFHNIYIGSLDMLHPDLQAYIEELQKLLNEASIPYTKLSYFLDHVGGG